MVENELCNIKSNESIVDSEKEKSENGIDRIASGSAVETTVCTMSKQAKVKFTKPNFNPENRKAFYDDKSAHEAAREKAFADGKPVYDRYTGAEIVKKQNEAKLRWGEDWQDHAAEADHIDPLNHFVNGHIKNPFLTTDDLKEIGNSDENFQLISRRLNQTNKSVGKGGSTQEEWSNDSQRMSGVEKYIESDESIDDVAQKIKDVGREAEANNNRKVLQRTIDNAVDTAHKAGIEGARQAGTTTLTISIIMNIVSVIRGEKDAKEAIKSTAADTAKATASGYAVSSALTTLNQSLTNSSSELISKLVDSNVPAKVISAIIVTGNTLKSWNNGEISTQECMIELGDKGLNMITAGYSAAVGQAVIPIPIVGAAIGALVGSVLTSSYYRNLVNDLKTREIEREERNRIIRECDEAYRQMRKFHAELQNYIDQYFLDYGSCFKSALEELDLAFSLENADRIIGGANEITRKLGGKVNYNTIGEFKNWFFSDEIDEF